MPGGLVDRTERINERMADDGVGATRRERDERLERECEKEGAFQEMLAALQMTLHPIARASQLMGRYEIPEARGAFFAVRDAIDRAKAADARS